MAHTPGPWRLYQGPLLVVEADDHLGPIAELRSRLDYAFMNPAVAETRDANARLIAAAPELLEALRIVLIDLDTPREAAALALASSAIAKATEGRA